MAYEERNNSGSMFPNARKEQDNHPDWEGSIMVDGKSYWLKAWNKQGQKGPWVSLSVKDKVAGARDISRQAGFEPHGAKPATYGDDDGDSIPFNAEFR